MRRRFLLRKSLVAVVWCLLAPWGEALDLDGNGMSDVWEDYYQVPDHTGEEDPDRDGRNNAQESTEGTNPFDAQDVLKCRIEIISKTQVEISWMGVKHKQYQVETSLDLKRWTALGNAVVGQDMELFFVDTIKSHGFYRVVVRDMDTDGDRLTDWEEGMLATNLLEADSDGDGVEDYDEIVYHRTDPLDGDSDQDGMDDGFEIYYSLDPTSNDFRKDQDGDGISNGHEYFFGTTPVTWTEDTDGDGIPDSYEIVLGTDPYNPDSDEDGPNDGWEFWNRFNPLDGRDGGLDYDQDGLPNYREYQVKANPRKADTDGDGLTDGQEVNQHGTNPLKIDSDGDLWGDGEEVAVGSDPMELGEMADPSADGDGDGFSNSAERAAGSDPQDSDDAPDPEQFVMLKVTIQDRDLHDDGWAVYTDEGVLVVTNQDDPKSPAEVSWPIPKGQAVTFTLERVEVGQVVVTDEYTISFSSDKGNDYIEHPDNSPKSDSLHYTDTPPDPDGLEWKIIAPKVKLKVAQAALDLLEENTLTAEVEADDLEADNYKFEIARSSGDSTWYTITEGDDPQYTGKARVAGTFKLKVTATIEEKKFEGQANVEVRFPHVDTIAGDAGVFSHCSQLWSETKARATPESRQELGCWIFLNTATETYEFGPTIEGPLVSDLPRATINLGPNPSDSPSAAEKIPANESGIYVVADFHTHTPTFYRSQGRGVGPSTGDKESNDRNFIPGLVFDYVGDQNGNAPKGWPLHSEAEIYIVNSYFRRAYLAYSELNVGDP